jgi:hypothetical protein
MGDSRARPDAERVVPRCRRRGSGKADFPGFPDAHLRVGGRHDRNPAALGRAEVIPLEKWLTFAAANFAPLQVAVGALLGFFATRLTMTKKERLDFKHQLSENGKNLMLVQQERYQDFTETFQKYINKKGDPTFDDFLALARAGDNYFQQQKIISNAILADQVDKQSRDLTLVPRIAEAVNVNLPSYYRVLQSISARNGFGFSGTLQRSNYEAMYAVVEKYADLQARG